MNKLLIAILNAIIVLHQENKAIAKELTGNDSIEKLWDEIFFAQLKDVMAADEGDKGDADSNERRDASDQPAEVRRGKGKR